MLVVRIGYPSANGAPKKAYFADGGIHAREWVSPTIVTYAINELLNNRATHEELLRSVDFYFLPNANPDGYEYTRQSGGDRMWRKTRSNNGNNNCLGVDPNRNFNVAFGGDGTSPNLCSEIYKGPKAFSEPETKAMSDFINNRASADWRVYNAFHSYAQMILTPWGYTYSLPADYSDLKSLGNQAATAIKASAGKIYEVGSVTELLSPGAGGSDDWAKGSGNFKYSYTLEVRDTGAYGFLLPANQILPTARENFAAILVQANFIKNSA
jgi:murein tripeptide amidase MpaA